MPLIAMRQSTPLRGIDADLNHQLAEVSAAEQTLKRFYGILQAWHDIFAIFDLAAAIPLAHVAQKIRLAIQMIGADIPTQRQLAREDGAHEKRKLILARRQVLLIVVGNH